MFAWLKRRKPVEDLVSASRVLTAFSALEGRIEEVEARQAQLSDRFNRFQNREGMRMARAEKETIGELADEAQELLKQERPGIRTPSNNLDLWRRIRRTP